MNNENEIKITYSEEETELYAETLAQSLHSGDIVALCGDLGAGKTAFVRGAAKYFRADGVASPTYTLVHEYKTDGTRNEVRKILHFDMYRINSEDDFLSLGFDDMMDGGTLTFIEWYDIIDEFFDGANIFIDIKKLGDNREITVKRIR